MADAPSPAEHIRKVIEARKKLRARFDAQTRATPSMSDGTPLGRGPTNRHGMPQLPPGQHPTAKWPVLNISDHPRISTEDWRFEVGGACESPLTLTWHDFMAMEQVEDVSDFHCVTTWSRFDIPWRGVRVSDVLALAGPKPEATHLMAYAYDGYSTNVSLAEALKDDVLLVHTADGEPLEVAHGGPCRMITPQLYAWKGAKWINRIELMTRDRPGFWEENGYSMTAYPWRNDRYR